MKAILEYDLTNQDDKIKYANTINADALYGALWRVMYDVLRKHWKYNDHSSNVQSVLNDIYQEAWAEVGDLLDE